MLGKHTLAPNEKAEIKVSYDTEKRPGPFQKYITLTTDIPGYEEIDIFVLVGLAGAPPMSQARMPPRIRATTSTRARLRSLIRFIFFFLLC